MGEGGEGIYVNLMSLSETDCSKLVKLLYLLNELQELTSAFYLLVKIKSMVIQKVMS